MESVIVDRNDKTGEVGFWMNRADALANLEYRIKMRTVLEAYKAYWRKNGAH